MAIVGGCMHNSCISLTNYMNIDLLTDAKNSKSIGVHDYQNMNNETYEQSVVITPSSKVRMYGHELYV